jgi:geranylgeranylglycerol-phosphate geranylgeranyltransferase
MMTALIRLTRPYYSIPLSCGLLVISLYIVGGDVSRIGASRLFTAFVPLLFVLSAGYMLNDVCDVAVDVINSPNRMLPQGRVAPKTALAGAGLLFGCGMGLSLFFGWKFFSVLLLITIGLIIYNLFSKKMGPFKPVLVAVLTTSLYPLSFSLTEPSFTPRLNSLYIFPVWLFLTTVGYEMLKDIRDIKGDSTVKTSNIRFYCSDPRCLRSARVILAAASLLTLLPYLLGYCGYIYLISSLLAIVLASLSLMHKPVKAIRFVYAEVFLITFGSLLDLLVYGP